VTNQSGTRPTGTELSRFNALRHGILSRYTVLPWEDATEYEAILAGLTAEHNPKGPTEEHLVEELAGIIWRKRRLRLAEAAVHHRGLQDALQPFRETAKAALVHVEGRHSELAAAAVHASAQTCDELTELDADEALTKAALEILGTTRNDAYEAALAVLREDTRDWWHSELAREATEDEEDEPRYSADPSSLRRFLETELADWYRRVRMELIHRPAVRDQAFGEALDPVKIERLCRYEVHLDRKLEHTSGMLFRLKELRRPADAA
jgi:hypothetical protein